MRLGTDKRQERIISRLNLIRGLRFFPCQFSVLTNKSISDIVCRLQDCHFLRKEKHTMRERQTEINRRRKRKEERQKAKRKAAIAEAAAKKGK